MSALRNWLAAVALATALSAAVAPGVGWAAGAGEASRAAHSLTASFPELTRPPQSPGPPAGTTVEEYVGSDTARVIDSRGRRSILLSSMPLRSRVGGDGTKPLSLALKADRPGEMRPENPVTHVRIATNPREGFTIGPDPTRLVTIVPLGIQGDAPDATVFAGQLLFAQAHRAADLLIRPSVDGVQTFEQLAGSTAPESFAYQLQLATGQSATLEDGAVVVRQAGDVIVRSLPPVALDADRRIVPVQVTLENEVVRLHAPHRDKGYRYPIAVDPDWTSSYNYHDQPGLGLQGWHAAGEAEYYDAFINNVHDPVADPDRNALGFFIRPIVNGASRVFPTGVGRQLFFNAPGTTHIRSVTYDHVHRFNDRDRQTLRLGLYGGGFGEADDVFDPTVVSTESKTFPSVPFPPGQDTPATSAVMWMYSSPCNPGDINCPPVIEPGTRTLLKVGSVQLELTDFDFPATQAPGTLRDLQDRWTNTTDTRTLDPSATDEGSGVRDLSVTVEDASGSHPVRSIQAPCHPNHDLTDPPQDNAICPRSLTLDQPLSLNTAGLPEGRSTLTVDAADLAANTAAAGGGATTFAIYLDRNKPSATVSGELFDASGSWMTPRRSSALTVTGTDTAGGPGNTSGIAHNHLTAVDERGSIVLDRDADTCSPPGAIAAPCEAGKASTFSVNPRTFPEGDIKFTATSTDLAGNLSEPVTWILRIDRTPPAARASGELVGLTSQHTNSTTPTSVTLQGRDASSGVARLQLVASNSDGERILADRDTCPADAIDPSDGSCPHMSNVEVSVDPGQLPDGPTTFIARAIDHAGIRSVDNQDWDTYVDHTPPDAPDRVDITPTSNSSVQVTWPTVTDQPLGSGNVSYEYLVTAGGQPIGGWQPTDNPYAQVGGLPPGVTITVLVRAIDAAGNVSNATEGEFSRLGIGPLNVAAGGGGCAVSAVIIGQLPWIPIVDRVWSPGGQITTLATVTCGFVVRKDVKATITFPVLRGRVCLERNHGLGWSPYGLCTPFRRTTQKVKTKTFKNGLKVFEVTVLAPDIGHCTLRTQGNAQFRTRIHIRSTIKATGVPSSGDTTDKRTIKSDGERQHCQTELDGWNRLARTNPERMRRALKSPPEVILGRTLGKNTSKDTRPVAKNGSRRGWEAHHIIPAGAQKATSARISGFRCHVHPNSRPNGIWLRGPALIHGKPRYDELEDDQKKRLPHGRTFTTNYYERINRMMATARSGSFGCDESKADKLLKRVEQQLVDGVENIHG